MSPLLLLLVRVCVCSVLLSLALASDARADAVLVQFRPPTTGVVAGYKVYFAFETTGAIGGTPINIGQRNPNTAGIANYLLDNLDPTRAYSVELTAYDSRGVESRRSNRIRIAARTETLGTPLWEQNFDTFAPGVHPVGFVDLRGDTRSSTNLFDVRHFNPGSPAFGTDEVSGSVATVYTGGNASSWGSYEITGRVWTSTSTAEAGIAARATNAYFSRYYELVQNTSGTWMLRGRNENALTCAGTVNTFVTQVPGTWYYFRYRITQIGGRTRLRARVWRSGSAAPGNWQVDCWTTLSASADSGVFGLRRGRTGNVYFDDLAVKPVVGTLDPMPY